MDLYKLVLFIHFPTIIRIYMYTYTRNREALQHKHSIRITQSIALERTPFNYSAIVHEKKGTHVWARTSCEQFQFFFLRYKRSPLCRVRWQWIFLLSLSLATTVYAYVSYICLYLLSLCRASSFAICFCVCVCDRLTAHWRWPEIRLWAVDCLERVE